MWVLNTLVSTGLYINQSGVGVVLVSDGLFTIILEIILSSLPSGFHDHPLENLGIYIL